MSTIEHTIDVPHLGGSVIGATFGRPYDPELPTLVMINSYTTSADLYRPQFADPALNGVVNLLALEPFGHGRTRAGYEHFTYWDSATANLQALAALGISEAFVLGTSQGGWIAVRMALMAPQVVKGLIPLGTSLDTESQRTRDLGCWDGPGFCTPFIDAFADSVDSDWVVPDQFVDDTFDAALGGLTHDERKFWLTTYRRNYAGDATATAFACARSTCAIATVSTAGWMRCDRRCCGCTAPPTRSTRSPTPKRRSNSSRARPTPTSR